VKRYGNHAPGVVSPDSRFAKIDIIPTAMR